jgi:uncharacterized protein (DUF2147 family)
MMFLRNLLLIVAYVSSSVVVLADDVAQISGVWQTVRHDALVNIADCGNATPCASLSWVSEVVSGGYDRDIRNLDPNLRDRALIGTPILWGFARTSDGWRDGNIYNPEDGKTFRAHLRLLSEDELLVEGCFGPLCRSQVWRRVQ